MRSRRWFRLLWLVAAVAVVLMVFAACEDEEEETATGTPAGTGTAAAGTPAGSPAAAVPELEDGVLQVGSDIAYAPIEFFEEGTTTPKGLDIDLANALAEELGVTTEFINTGFDGIIGALNAERFDVIMSAMTVTDERSKEIDFVPYFIAGTDILVAAGNPKNIQAIEDLSGLTVGVQIATIQVDQLDGGQRGPQGGGKAGDQRPHLRPEPAGGGAAPHRPGRRRASRLPGGGQRRSPVGRGAGGGGPGHRGGTLRHRRPQGVDGAEGGRRGCPPGAD